MSQIKQDYRQHITALKIKGSIVGCILSILLVSIGASSDYLLYNEFFTEFLYARLVCTALTLVILWLHFHKTINKSFIRALTFSWLFLIQALICYMIVISNKFDLAYYNAIILLILTAAILLPLTKKEILMFSIFSISIYLSAVLCTDITTFGIVYNNIFTLVLASVVGVTATNLKSKLQFQHFCLNYKLNRKIEEIKKTQEQLINKEKNEATADLSAELIHEINNPLNFTITALNALGNISNYTDNEELKDIYADMRAGTLRIHSTIDNLKNLSLLQKDIKRTDFNVFEAIETAKKLKEDSLRKFNLKISIDPNLMINASQTHFIQIFINLIENSIYSLNKIERDKPQIRIFSRQKDGKPTFVISDNGKKCESTEIIDSSKDSIINSPRDKRLDLSIATKLIEQHSGKVYISTKLSQNQISFFLS